MDITKYKKIIDEVIIESMISYMEFDEECVYTDKDIEECKKLLINYLDKISAIERPNDNEIINQVKYLVTSLNKLNERSDYTLIETEQREDICKLINESAVDIGLEKKYEDITEEWREW